MNLYAHIVHLGHVTDLLCLGDASRVAQVGLNDIQRPVLKELAEAPARVAPLSSGQGQVHRFDVLEHTRIAGHGGLLIIHDAVGLQCLPQQRRGVSVEQRMDLHNDVQVGAARLPGRGNALHRANVKSCSR